MSWRHPDFDKATTQAHESVEEINGVKADILNIFDIKSPKNPTGFASVEYDLLRRRFPRLPTSKALERIVAGIKRRYTDADQGEAAYIQIREKIISRARSKRLRIN